MPDVRSSGAIIAGIRKRAQYAENENARIRADIAVLRDDCLNLRFERNEYGTKIAERLTEILGEKP